MLLALALVSCGGKSSEERSTSTAVATAALATTSAQATEPPPKDKSVLPTEASSPTETALHSSPTASPQPLFYNLPPATLTESTGLYASPNRSELTVPEPIPAGITVYVMGRNETSSHLRVVWNTGVGWVPISFTDYIGRPDKTSPLPVFTREPPACAEPLVTQTSLYSTWTSDRKQRVAVVVDLFRSRYGDFPPSYLALTVNGTVVESSRRQIVERGQFSLKDVVFTLPDYIKPGDVLGYLLDTSSDEDLSFKATIFSVPEGCRWPGLQY